MSQLFAISPSAPQDEAVVSYVEAHWPRDIWAQGIIFLPNRRSVTLVRQAFLRHIGDRAALLPAMVPLADIDPYLSLLAHEQASDALHRRVMSPLTRRMLLAAQVERFLEARGDAFNRRYVMHMADALAQFMDTCVRHEAQCADFDALVPARFSNHWQQTMAFLAIVLKYWPEVEREQGAISQAAYLHERLTGLVRAWQASPPDIPVLAAGSTGSQPATAALLSMVATLPRGALLLPGVPCGLSPAYEEAIGPGHPLFHVKSLALQCGQALHSIPLWQEGKGADPFMREVFSPLLAPMDIAFPEKHYLMPCADEWEEARLIAVLVREALETPQRRIMVVSPDRAILDRVGRLLTRWDIHADSSSAGQLREHPFVVWLLRLLALVSSECGALETLAFFQHRLSFSGSVAHEDFVRGVDLSYARGIERKRGFASLEHVLRNLESEACQEVVPPLVQALRGVFDCHIRKMPVDAWLEAIRSVAAVCGIHSVDEAIEALFVELASQNAGEGLDAEALGLLVEYASDVPWFAPSAQPFHPRVSLHSPIEARMVSADVVVLAGLNEDSWPAMTQNPWLNRTMQQQLGLPTAEHELSLAAHDFMLLSSQSEVYFTRAERMHSRITVPSRWWKRLELAALRAGMPLCSERTQQVVSYARALDLPEAYLPAEPPRPNPPVDLRPHQLRATEVEQLMFNPYAIYARHVLGLKELDEISREPDHALFGTLAHRVLETLHASGLPDDDALEALADRALRNYAESPIVSLFWRERLIRAMRFFLQEHEERRSFVEDAQAEKEMQLVLGEGDAAIHIHGRADRVEHWRDGSYCYIDFKSGSSIPSKAAVERGEAPQLPLYFMAGLQAEGRRAEAEAHFAYWRLPSGGNEGETCDITMSAERIAELWQGYADMVAYYLCRQNAFLYAPEGGKKPYLYDALARAGEWGGAES